MAKKLVTEYNLLSKQGTLLGRDDLYDQTRSMTDYSPATSDRHVEPRREEVEYRPSSTPQGPMGRDDFLYSQDYTDTLVAQFPDGAVLDNSIRYLHEAQPKPSADEHEAAIARMTELVTDAEFELVTNAVVKVDIERTELTFPPDTEFTELLAKAAYDVYFKGSNVDEARFMAQYKEELMNQLPTPDYDDVNSAAEMLVTSYHLNLPEEQSSAEVVKFTAVADEVALAGLAHQTVGRQQPAYS